MKFIVLLGLLILAIVADAGVSMNNPFFCYARDPIRSITRLHGTATSYEAIRRYNFTTVSPYVTTCTPSKIWYLGRHGGRFPHPLPMEEMFEFANSSVQQRIIDNYDEGRTTLCRQDLELIRDWEPEPNFNMQNASMITDSGVLAMNNIARRFQAVFPTLLPSVFSADQYHFRHTITDRSNASIRAFATGLFGEAGAQNVVYENVPERDWFLRPIDFCPEFVDELSDWSASQRAFRGGPEFQQMMEEVNRKLGFQGRNELSVKEVLDMWEWCRFETASKFEVSGSETGDDSAWCAPFSVAHHLLLEFHEDLGSFYFSGYGVRNQRMLENLSCGKMQNLLNHISSDDGETARIFVTSNQEIQTMLVTLGAFRDPWPIHQHNHAQRSDRNWATSVLSPLGVNLVVIRFDCEDDDDLLFLLNERPILVPGCDQQTGICKLSFFLNRFQRFMNANCEEYFCSMN